MTRLSKWVVLALTVALTACGRAAPPAQPAQPAASNTATAAPGFSQVTGLAPAGSLVALEPVGGPSPMPEGGALLDQFSKQFVPTMLFVRVGQRVTFRNSEDQQHNVTIVRSRTGTAVFNESQDPFTENQFTFDRPGEFEVNCDVHPGMRATIVATTTPYAMYADAGGRFTLPQVAHGAYRLQITSDGQIRERAVQIAGASVDLGQ